MLQLRIAIHLSSLGLPWKKALPMAAKLGAKAVEVDGRNQITPREMSRTAVRHVRKMMEDSNVTVAAVQFRTRSGYGTLENLEQRVQATKDAMSMAYELGARVLVNNVGRVPENEESPAWSLMRDALTDIGNHGHKVGVTLAARTGSETGEDLKRLIDSLPPMSIGVSFDPGALIVNGYSVTDALKALGASVLQFRAHDAVHDVVAGRGIETQLGRGSADIAEIFSELEQHSFNGYTIVESAKGEETLPSDAPVEIGEAMEYLTSFF